MNESYYHKQSKRIGWDKLKLAFQEIVHAPEYVDMDRENIPVTSVGIGCGALEADLSQEFGISPIGVDPDPFSSRITCPTGWDVHYATLDDALLARPELANGVLMLVCPLPNEASYDLEAIQKGNWSHVFIVFESTGSSGSTRLLQWMLCEELIEKSMWVRRGLDRPLPTGHYWKQVDIIKDAKSFLYRCMVLKRIRCDCDFDAPRCCECTNRIESFERIEEERECIVMWDFIHYNRDIVDIEIHRAWVK